MGYLDKKEVDTSSDLVGAESLRFCNRLSKIIDVKSRLSTRIAFVFCFEHFHLKEGSMEHMREEAIRVFNKEYSLSREEFEELGAQHFLNYALMICASNDYSYVNGLRDLSNEQFETVKDISLLLAESYEELKRSIYFIYKE